MNTEQINWLNEYCKKQSEEGELFFLTNAGNIEYIYQKLKEMETN
jgi:hypothetical protein